MRKIIGLIGVLLLILASTVVFAENNISSTVVVDGEHVTITGQFANIGKSIPVTLRVGSIENILYVWQTMTTEEGSFSFDFEVPNNTPSGEYEYLIASNLGDTGYVGTITYNYTEPEPKNIESFVSTNGQRVNITGTVLNAKQGVPVTLLVGDEENILYLWQTHCQADGSFSFNFEMPDSAASGIYRYQIRALNEEDLYVSSFNYIIDSRIVCETSIDGYEINISGTVVNATETNTVSIVFGGSDNPIYTAETACGEDGEYAFDFTMPAEVQDGEYNWVINTDFENLSYNGVVSYTRPTYQIDCTVNTFDEYVDLWIWLVGKPEIRASFELVIKDEDKIIYTDTSGGAYGDGGAILFMMPKTVPSGEYEMIITETLNNSEPYYGTLNYVNPYAEIDENFVNAEINIDIINYVPKIVCNVSCINEKTVNFVAVNLSDDKIVLEDTVTQEDDNYSLTYTLPSLITGKDYTVTISCTDNEKMLFSINVEINPSIILVSVSGDVQVSDSVRLDVRAKTTDSDLIDKSASFTTDQSFSLTIPNVVANAFCSINLHGYQTIETTEEHNNGSIITARTINPDYLYTLYISDSGQPAWYKFVPKYSGLYSLYITSGLNEEIYVNKNGIFQRVELEDVIYMSYPQTYYIKIPPRSTYTQFILKVAGNDINKSAGNAFETIISSNKFFSYINDSGKLYKDQTVLKNTANIHPINWLCNFNGSLYFNANGSLMKLTDTSYMVVGEEIDARYITADEECIYFSNWSDSGRIYKGSIAESGEIIFEKICNDSASWITVDSDYLYYKNALDRNRNYKVLKTSENIETGELVN